MKGKDRLVINAASIIKDYCLNKSCCECVFEDDSGDCSLMDWSACDWHLDKSEAKAEAMDD